MLSPETEVAPVSTNFGIDSGVGHWKRKFVGVVLETIRFR